jgi:hypothetical protein
LVGLRFVCGSGYGGSGGGLVWFCCSWDYGWLRRLVQRFAYLGLRGAVSAGYCPGFTPPLHRCWVGGCRCWFGSAGFCSLPPGWLLVVGSSSVQFWVSSEFSDSFFLYMGSTTSSSSLVCRLRGLVGLGYASSCYPVDPLRFAGCGCGLLVLLRLVYGLSFCAVGSAVDRFCGYLPVTCSWGLRLVCSGSAVYRIASWL